MDCYFVLPRGRSFFRRPEKPLQEIRYIQGACELVPPACTNNDYGRVFLCQRWTAKQTVADRLWDLENFVEILRRKNDCPIQLILPYLDYSRAPANNPPVSFCCYLARLQTLALDRIFVFDVHNPDLWKGCGLPLTFLSLLSYWTEYFLQLGPIDGLVSPDLGRRPWLEYLGSQLNLPVYGLHKNFPEKSRNLMRHSDLANKRLVLFDDEIVTGRTLLWAISLLREQPIRELHVAAVYPFCPTKTLLEIREKATSLTVSNMLDRRIPKGIRTFDLFSRAADVIEGEL